MEPSFEGDWTYAAPQPFRLSAGGELQPFTLRYAVYGELHRRPVILVCHALSGSARAADWWGPLFGPERPFDLRHVSVLCVNILGSCYGSTGPTSINPHTGRSYGGDFPLIMIEDMVRSQALLLDHLGIGELAAVIGGSIGGMQALLWASLYPERVRRCVAVGTAPLNAMALALNHVQQQAIRLDPAWCGGHYPPGAGPLAGMALARAIASCSYKSPSLFEERFGRRPNRTGEDPRQSLLGRYDIGGYLDYQGELLRQRFDPNCYLIITRAMDAFDLEEQGLRQIRCPVSLIGISTDWLFPVHDILKLQARLTAGGISASYLELQSTHGHDAFLADASDLVALLTRALSE